MFRQILKDKGGKKWAITSASIIAFLLVATIVLTCIIPSLMDLLFGGPRKTQTPGGSNQYYTASEGVTDKKTSFAFSDAVNQSINDEGITLLKNQDNVLPISSTAKISVFGKNSVNLVYGSSGSGGGETEGFKTLYDSLDAVGVSYNTTLKDFYNSSASGRGRPANPPMDSGYPTGYETGETAVSMYTQAVKDSFAEYNDLALVVISRTGGETFDLPMSMKQSNGSKVNGAASAEDHYLELDQNEQDMLQMVCENFNNVVLVINSNTTLELGFLDAIVDGDSTFNNYNYADKVKGAL
ncbi:MAG: glycoside hydrolase family 3 C-terminal domain-containing protein, partial [Clostridia bacterium]|nr:glycoside hydrolase family 3 C-terminal domain-containing protein [Clostridia bacterium]